jgi:NAD(P) transhydrogenase
MRACKGGKHVAAVERFAQVGGGCTHWATIPSKALRQAIYHTTLCNQNSIYKSMEMQAKFSFPELLATANAVIAKQVDLREGFYDRNDVAADCRLRGSSAAHDRSPKPRRVTKLSRPTHS